MSTFDQKLWHTAVLEWMARWPQITGAGMRSNQGKLQILVFRRGTEPLQDFPKTHQGYEITTEQAQLRLVEE
jgi:hypothetical protein